MSILKNIDWREFSLNYYGLVDLRIRCASHRDAELFEGILQNYLLPFLQVKEATGQSHYTISLRQGIFDEVGSDWQHMTFLLDDAVSDFRFGVEKHYSSSRRDIFNPLNGTLFRISGTQVEIVYVTEEALVKDVQRVIKQLLITEVENAGGAVLHASAFSLEGKAICYVGEKGQGKTTCLLESLKIEGAKYITNDRLPIIPIAGKFHVLGWFEELRLVQPSGGKKKKVRVLELCEPPQIEIRPVLPRLIVLPDCLSRLEDESDGREVIKGQLLTPVDPQRPKWLGYSKSLGFGSNALLNPIPVKRLQWQFLERDALLGKIQEVVASV
ncbi:hypothetical protein [Pseudomonas chlororaphis]|nr:hypothetical protein [Pseudomonas chlororaphis]WDH04634.1 hypothetical protein PUP57_02810 [Pseudomonas chlororaphis]WDH12611.1 hypothetical protein PUP64_11970 [Pseudomonas chlororaphis]